ncbi:MAG TPA: DNA primase catalytic subunit PriS [Ramlibacter sp.]|nr:DNA primase catalytic subunit PriS [Ramlibacter sp.]
MDWANGRFAWYYDHHDVPLPTRYGRREFGFMFLAKTFMVRHQAFGSAEEFHRYLVQHAPAHAYYSTAYYENPRAETMREKGWLGADLIFDLDADHVEGAKDKSFEEMLRLIQKEAVKLVHDFLLDDFGFAPEHLRIVFSGGRGYHIHVTDPAVWSLGSAERREIVDYLSGQGLDFERVLGERIVHINTKGMRRVKEKRTEARADAPGWGGRIVRGELELLEELRALDLKAARAQLREWGLSDDKARELLTALHADAKDREGKTFLDRVRETGNIPTGHALDKVLRTEAVQKKALAVSTGETDEPVTSDIKRLIRLPGSLHGKTALRVTPLTLDRLETFDPLRETVAFGDAPVEVVVSKPEKVRLKEKEWDVQPGKQVLPEHVALFLCLRRKATVL